MITDDERREIANELRRQAAYSSGSLGEWWQRLQEIVTGEIDFANPQETYRAIADLIDIPTCVMTNVGGDFEDSFQCSNCMNEFDMPDYDRYPYKRCPECGAVVLDED